MSEELVLTFQCSKLKIAPVLWQGEVLYARGFHQLAMVQEIFGEDLADFLSRQAQEGRGGVVDAIAGKIEHLVLAMADRGLFHADIKPKNIVVHVSSTTREVHVRLIDFEPKFMSAHWKDVGSLETPTRAHLTALYGVSMFALLYMHFNSAYRSLKSSDRRTASAYARLRDCMFESMRKYRLDLPTHLEVDKSKYAKIVVRHLQHYKLLTDRKRQTVMNSFLSFLRETIEVPRQTTPNNPPTFNQSAVRGDNLWLNFGDALDEMNQTLRQLSRPMLQTINNKHFGYEHY